MFLELFEAEAHEIIKRPLQVHIFSHVFYKFRLHFMIFFYKVEYLLQDSSILLPPTGTPMTGIEFQKRLPCGEVS